MKTSNLFLESLDTMRESKHHNHFTNECLACKSDDNEDRDMIAVTIERRSGLDMRLYIEKDYCCKTCFYKHVLFPKLEAQ